MLPLTACSQLHKLLIIAVVSMSILSSPSVHLLFSLFLSLSNPSLVDDSLRLPGTTRKVPLVLVSWLSSLPHRPPPSLR
eukprot:765878-Hanusia_phi.AAC.6